MKLNKDLITKIKQHFIYLFFQLVYSALGHLKERMGEEDGEATAEEDTSDVSN